MHGIELDAEPAPERRAMAAKADGEVEDAAARAAHKLRFRLEAIVHAAQRLAGAVERQVVCVGTKSTRARAKFVRAILSQAKWPRSSFTGSGRTAFRKRSLSRQSSCLANAEQLR